MIFKLSNQKKRIDLKILFENLKKHLELKNKFYPGCQLYSLSSEIDEKTKQLIFYINTDSLEGLLQFDDSLTTTSGLCFSMINEGNISSNGNVSNKNRVILIRDKS